MLLVSSRDKSKREDGTEVGGLKRVKFWKGCLEEYRLEHPTEKWQVLSSCVNQQ